MVEKSLEYALFKVFENIGNNYKLPIGEHIISVFDVKSKIRNPYFGQKPKKVKFMFGTQKELNIWIKETKDKYPVVWLVYPLKKTVTLDNSRSETYKKVRLIFAINNTVDKLVQTRVQTTKVVLQNIVNVFKVKMKQGLLTKFIKISKDKEPDEEFHPNYSANEQKDSGSIDIWDAIVFDCEMILIPDCIK